MPGSNSLYLISFDIINRTRDLTNIATIGNLDYTFYNSDGFIDIATESILGYIVNSLNEITDPLIASNFGYIINNSNKIIDLDIIDFLQNIYNQLINMLSNLNYEMDLLIIEFFR
jgi:hypothetical protein